jgi:hypothetical protein
MPFWRSKRNPYYSMNSYSDGDPYAYDVGLFDQIPPVANREMLIPKEQSRVRWDMLLIWFLVLTTGFVISSLLCSTDYDECSYSDPILQIRNLMDMLVYSVPIFFIGYLHSNECNKFKKPYFIPLILISTTAFGFISWIPFLHVSIQKQSIQQQWTIPTYAVFIVATLLVLVLIAYHIRLAFKVEGNTRLKYGYKYLLYALISVGFYIGSYVYLVKTFPIVNVHFHHWFIFWFLSMFAQFNTHVSRISQAICIGIFLQGASAYGITDTIFEV